MRNEKETMKELKNFNPMALREKYSVRNLNKKNNYSSFWLDNGWDNNTITLLFLMKIYQSKKVLI